MAKRRLNSTNVPLPKRRDVRLYTPDSETLEVFVDNACVLRLDSVSITVDNGVTREKIKNTAA